MSEQILNMFRHCLLYLIYPKKCSCFVPCQINCLANICEWNLWVTEVGTHMESTVPRKSKLHSPRLHEHTVVRGENTNIEVWGGRGVFRLAMVRHFFFVTLHEVSLLKMQNFKATLAEQVRLYRHLTSTQFCVCPNLLLTFTKLAYKWREGQVW